MHRDILLLFHSIHINHPIPSSHPPFSPFPFHLFFMARGVAGGLGGGSSSVDAVHIIDGVIVFDEGWRGRVVGEGKGMEVVYHTYVIYCV